MRGGDGMGINKVKEKRGAGGKNVRVEVCKDEKGV